MRRMEIQGQPRQKVPEIPYQSTAGSRGAFQSSPTTWRSIKRRNMVQYSVDINHKDLISKLPIHTQTKGLGASAKP